MNYYQPLELVEPSGEGSGKFQFTKSRDSKTVPIGYCAEKGCKHDTPEEASNCYRKFLIEQRDGMWPGGFPMSEEEKGVLLTFYGSY